MSSTKTMKTRNWNQIAHIHYAGRAQKKKNQWEKKVLSKERWRCWWMNVGAKPRICLTQWSECGFAVNSVRTEDFLFLSVTVVEFLWNFYSIDNIWRLEYLLPLIDTSYWTFKDVLSAISTLSQKLTINDVKITSCPYPITHFHLQIFD